MYSPITHPDPFTRAPVDPLWVRIVCDPDDPNSQYVRVYEATTRAGLDTAAPCMTSNDATLDVSGGNLGFAVGSGSIYIDNLTVATPSASGWTTDAVDSFDQTGGYGLEQPTHDAAGNLTWDGVYQYQYDAWNHLVSASRAYRDASGDVQIGQTITTAQYDGLGRRIVKRVQKRRRPGLHLPFLL